MRALLLCVLLSACAATTAPVRDSGRLLAGAPIGAPDGLSAYCARRPAECGSEVDVVLRGRISATGAASWQSAAFQARAPGQSAFHAMMLSRTPAGRHAGAPIGARMDLSPTRWLELVRVNREINHALRPVTDRVLYGVEEYWDRPLAVQGAGARGDCEDYALEKRARLLALGWAPDMLAMAVAVAPGVGLHAVLIAQTDRGDIVLDNLHDAPRGVNELRYTWISRQAGESLTRWASAELGAARPDPAARETASGSRLFQQMMAERVAARQNAPADRPAAAPRESAILVRDIDAAPLPVMALTDLDRVAEAEKPRVNAAARSDKGMQRTRLAQT